MFETKSPSFSFYTLQIQDERLVGPELQHRIEAFLHTFSLANAGVGSVSFPQYCSIQLFTIVLYSRYQNVGAVRFHRSGYTSNSNSTSRQYSKN